MNSISDRLVSIIGDQSLRSFALDIGVSETMVRKYLKGGMPGLDNAVKICALKGINVHWFATGEGAQYYSDNKMSYEIGEPSRPSYVNNTDDEFALIDGYHVTIDEFNDQHPPQIRRRLAFRRKWLEYRGLNPEDLRIYFVKTYLEGGTISGGDSVMIDTSDTSIADGVFALRLNSNMLIRWLRLKVDGSVDVFTDISREIDENVPKERQSEINILGRIVWLGKDFK